MYIQKYSKGTHKDVHYWGRTHTLETDFIHLASQFQMSVHLFHLVPKCGFLPRSGQVTKARLNTIPSSCQMKQQSQLTSLQSIQGTPEKLRKGHSL